MLDFICRDLIQSAFTSQSVECIPSTQESPKPNNDKEWARHSYRSPEELLEDWIGRKGCDLVRCWKAANLMRGFTHIVRTLSLGSPISRCPSAAFLL